ncbi:hypothetical protein Desfe_0507 [Desulfurococcus amylolyticus DSM 16532]|uniref:Uncharacterized protein n=1 Tax=Desulfurococcus amylolyticus DSM 16532 TaxID=768672 RepID=I3XR37_DESAM|nr:hypothetical protein Desfe_0507 [Desulfurococcus amylolyticus DSM 16532]
MELWIVFMLGSWLFILGLVAWCIWKNLKAQKK